MVRLALAAANVTDGAAGRLTVPPLYYVATLPILIKVAILVNHVNSGNLGLLPMLALFAFLTYSDRSKRSFPAWN